MSPTFATRVRAHRNLLLAGLALLCVASGACRAPLVCMHKGGAAWRELRSEHFVLRTDVSSADARAALRSFEGLYRAFDVMRDLAFPARPAPAGRIEATLYSRGVDFEAANPSVGWAYGSFKARNNDPEARPSIHVPAHAVTRYPHVLLHELTHYFVNHYLPGAPTWLNEGLAEYFETYASDGRQATIGAPTTRIFSFHKMRRDAARELLRLPKIDELRAMPPALFYADHRGRNYASAWALVHLLASNHRDRFRRYLAELGGEAREPDAFAKAFGDLPPGALQNAHRARIFATEWPAWKTAVRPDPTAGAYSERELDDSEIHLFFGRLRPFDAKSAAASAADLDEAKRRGVGADQVSYWRAVLLAKQRRLAEALAELERARAAAPASPEIAHLRVRLLGRYLARKLPGVARATYDAALSELEQRARTSQQLNTVAWSHARAGRTDAGLPLALRSVRLQPGCYACWDTLAVLQAKKGEREAALASARRALNLVPERATRVREALTRRLESLEKGADPKL